ncbi:unnamed protein product [Linum tenue]|uniref:Aminotransferase-like plant mobile domain-containing protein n=1 Tax=Linum tenue TaxID=586396 RepID=A0AAV0L8U7_9ROSI|nr:unnamed protein product [Linum tenue]
MYVQKLGSFHLRSQKPVKYDQRYDPFLKSIGFASIPDISNIRLDGALITALVERWRPETSTFHLFTGECTITLQDVELLLGLKIEGLPLTTKTEKSETD